MKKILIMILLAQLMPLTLMAQDDDLYFVPRKNKEIKKSVVHKVPQQTYYCGSNRSIDEYNRRPSLMLDSLGAGAHIVTADSLTADSMYVRGMGRSIKPGTDYEEDGDYSYTKRMKRFEGYNCSGMDYEDYCDLYNSGYRNGYMDGLTSWNISIGWYDPWWYSSRFYGWNGWYNAYYFGGWYNPWYYGWGWYDPWWHGGCYYPVHHYAYYSGPRGTRNHSYGAYGNGSRRHGVYNGHYRGYGTRDRHGYNGRYDNNRNRGFGNNGSWNNRSNNRGNSNGSWNNRSNNRRGNDLNRGGGFGGSRSNRGGGFGGGSRGGGSRGGRFGGGR